MPSEVPILESADSLPDEVIGDLARNLLLSFFATHGESCEQRFQEDGAFQQLLWDECIHTLGLLAAVMACQGDQFAVPEIAVHAIANARQDSDEIAALRVFTFKNMVPKEALERPEIAARVSWFLDEYQRSRGAALAVAGH